MGLLFVSDQISNPLNKVSQNQLRLLKRLKQRKQREKEQLFIVEGERAVEQVVNNGVLEIDSVFIAEGKEIEILVNQDKIFVIENPEMTEIADTENTQGVLALCKTPAETTLKSLEHETGVLVATDSIQDPGNLGTIIRTAAWFNSKAILLGKGSVDMFNPKVVRSTVGATGTLPFITGELSELLPELEKQGWEVLLLDGNEGSIPISSHKPSDKVILVVGNEANGVSQKLLQSKRVRILIPAKTSSSTVESLNAAVALSIALWTVNN